MNDAAFRRALAYSVDTKKIVEGVYGKIVKAASPTGLLPTWDTYVDTAAVNELGFKFDTAQAKKILADAGYKDTNGDGYVESPGGAAIKLSLIVPSGWTDWMEAIRVISQGAQAAGINIVPEFPDAGALDDARTQGKFDLLLNNWTELSNTPWTFYNYLYQLPVQEKQFSANFERFNNPQAWDLVQKLSRTPSNDAQFKTILGQLQRITLTEMPSIPLWYNGMWSQANESVWTNWPSSTSTGSPKSFPTTWNNYWEKGSIYMLTQIKPVSEK
jgi:peptide/nickel transport system substrate-binding protein